MEENEGDTISSNVKLMVSYDEENEAMRSNIFAQLKPYCIDLLSLLQNPSTNKHSLATLENLLQLLRNAPPSSLQPFFDYVLFPLLMLFDASVDCRSKKSKSISFEEGRVRGKEVSDVVAEGVVQCLEELLSKCRLVSVDQMVVMLKKLTSGALLSPSEASEEIRLGVIKCFRGLLLGLHPCSDETCLCQHKLSFPALSKGNAWKIHLGHVSKPEECLLTFLQSQTASAAIGHWLSLLLKAADTEAGRGHRGSADLRIEAFWTLRILVAKVGTAEALAFFLPGVVSQFAKVLHVSKTMISGAAGSVEAIDQAVRALAEYLMIVLCDDDNICGVDDINITMDRHSESILETLRQLPMNVHDQTTFVAEIVLRGDVQSNVTDSKNGPGSLQVNRTKEWIEKTAVHVDKLLSMILPHICVHPAKKVREGLLAAIKGLLSKCTYSLKGSRLMLLECLCVLACDDFECVSSGAQQFLEVLFSSRGRKHHVNSDVTEILNRLMEKLPKLILASDGLLAISHAQKMLVVIYYSGPEVLVDHLLGSPVTAARFLDVFALCFGQNSAFSGSLEKLISARPSSTGYLSSIAELRAGIGFTSGNRAITTTAPLEATQLPVQDREFQYILDNGKKDYELPRIPPWFLYVGSEKLYLALAGILRLVGLSLASDVRSGGCLSVVIDIPLGCLRKLVSEVRKKEYSGESWQSWYNRTGSGQLLRQASTAACMLNEMIFGVSNQALEMFRSMFKSKIEKEEHSMRSKFLWVLCQEEGSNTLLIDCIGNILHEYLSPEVWDLPIEHKPSLNPSDDEASTLHFFSDTAMLQQVIIDGIGIFNLCLGKDFASSGFLHSSLYLLLENLICSNFQIRKSADVVLHILAATCGHSTVGHLVLANSDYIIDSVCRQLRHLDLNPHVPNVLAAMLSYIGIAHKILPLLEEPMRAASMELEILGRHQHPNLTLPFLKAVSEIVKASKHEAYLLPTQAEFYNDHVKSIISGLEKKTKPADKCSESHNGDNINTFLVESDCLTDEAVHFNDNMNLEQWETILFKLNDSKRYRRTVGSIAVSCLTAATPLLASSNQAPCLVALDIVEDGIASLAKVEEAYKIEKKIKEEIEEVIQLHSYYHLQDTLDATDDGADENRLLPAMNKIWPFLVVCMQNKNPVAVRRCLDVVSNVIQICGGDFFSRRFHTDGQHFWNLLNTSHFHKRPISKEDRTPLQLPYRNSPYSSKTEDSMAEVTNQKVQISVLNMITNLSQNKKSASSLEAVLKKVSGLIVGIACSGVIGLQDASVKALVGLASMDPDLIWLLLADVYYSLKKKKDLPTPPTGDFPELPIILPPPLSSKGYLYVLYGGKSYGFDVDYTSVEMVFKRLQFEVYTMQM